MRIRRKIASSLLFLSLFSFLFFSLRFERAAAFPFSSTMWFQVVDANSRFAPGNRFERTALFVTFYRSIIYSSSRLTRSTGLSLSLSLFLSFFFPFFLLRTSNPAQSRNDLFVSVSRLNTPGRTVLGCNPIIAATRTRLIRRLANVSSAEHLVSCQRRGFSHPTCLIVQSNDDR